jgi:plastocyanin
MLMARVQAQGQDCEKGMVFTLNPAAEVSAKASATKTQASVPASATATSLNHKVQVAPGGALIYQPPNIVADVGDTVSFIFTNKNLSALMPVVTRQS